MSDDREVIDSETKSSFLYVRVYPAFQKRAFIFFSLSLVSYVHFQLSDAKTDEQKKVLNYFENNFDLGGSYAKNRSC